MAMTRLSVDGSVIATYTMLVPVPVPLLPVLVAISTSSGRL
jgi:hypothetical protein